MVFHRVREKYGRQKRGWYGEPSIPEEIMKKPRYAKMFNKLRSMGFDDDGASNGIFLPDSKNLTQKIDLPGHWSSHAQYKGGGNQGLRSK